MEMTTHGLLTLVHGMGFGALYLLACSFAIAELYLRYSPTPCSRFRTRTRGFWAGGW